MKAHYTGKVLTEWLDDGRKMQLHKVVAFTNIKGQKFIAPERSVVDGSSIPRVLWPLIGSPFVGKHRTASVIHDVECQDKSKPYKVVHRMYYDAIRASGVNKYKAKLMYLGLKIGAPRW